MSEKLQNTLEERVSGACLISDTGARLEMEERHAEEVDACDGWVRCRSSLIPDAVADVGVREALMVAEESWAEQIRDADTLCFTTLTLGTDKGKLDLVVEEDDSGFDK